MHLEIRGAEKLSFREKQVVILKETGKSTQDISTALDLSPATVNTLYNRARTKGYEVVLIAPGTEWGVGMHNEASED